VKFPFISEHSQQDSIPLQCKALEVSESGDDAWKDRKASQYCREDAKLAAEIQHMVLDHRQVSGSPRLHAVLKTRGITCSRKRVVRLMQQLGLSAQTKRSPKPTTKSDPRARFAPNHLHRELSAEQPNSKWVTETKAVATAEGWLCLAVILDLFSPLVVGWAMAPTEDEQLVKLVRLLAVAQRHPPTGLFHHADRGSEFPSDRSLAVLEDVGIQVSISRTADGYENAVMESFLATVTKECLDRAHFQTRQQARSAIFEDLVCFLNPIRFHSMFQDVSPLAFEQTRKSPMSSSPSSTPPFFRAKFTCEMSQYAQGRGETTVANQQQLDMLEQGVVTWNHWRKEHPDVKPDLEEASLIGAALIEANLNNAKLRGADLLGADLSSADLRGADLGEAILSEAILSGADLFVADLSSANLFGATLIEATLIEATLSEASLREATLSGADLSSADLSRANLSEANLSNAKLRGANLLGADLSSANLNETDVSDIKYLDRNHEQRFLTWVYPRAIMRGKYQGIRVASCYGNATFKRDAQDQDFLDTLEKHWEETWRMWLFRAWAILDYGRSMFGVFLLALIIVLGFGLTYHFNPDLLSYGSHSQTPFSPFYFSIVTFTTLGFGDVTPNGVGGEMIVSLQVISGYLTLGLLISILANKVARRS
jgi:putative transposase